MSTASDNNPTIAKARPHVKVDIVFPADDIRYFMLWGIPELRNQMRSTRKRFNGENDFHWRIVQEDLINCYRLAIDILESYELKTPLAAHGKFINAQALKDSIDIVELAERYTQLTKSGRYFTGLCPFHSEKKPSFFVYPEEQTWHCFGTCNTGGDVISFVMRAENLDFKGAIVFLGGHQ